MILALAWASRIVDAALGMPSVADVSRPEWDRNPVLRCRKSSSFRSSFPHGTRKRAIEQCLLSFARAGLRQL